MLPAKKTRDAKLVKWRRQDMEKLIYLVQQHKCIYFTRSVDYLNRTKKEEAFYTITNAIRRNIPAITYDEVKRKWRTLRVQYMSERRSIEAKKKFGAKTNEEYRPKLWCFELLAFLHQHAKTKPRADNFDGTEDNALIDFTADIASSSRCDLYDTQDSLPSPVAEETKPNISASPSRYEEFETDESLPSPVMNEVQPNISAPSSRCDMFDAEDPLSNDFDDIQNRVNGVKTIIEKRNNNIKQYAWLGCAVVNQMDEIAAEDRADAAWEVQVLMRNLVQRSREKRLKQATQMPVSEAISPLLPILRSCLEIIEKEISN